MRPVNLIPPEERRDRAPIRTGPLAYMLVGVLALGLAGVTMVVLSNNKISDRKAKVAQLNQQQAAVESRASQLQPFVSFSQTAQQRVAAIHKVANDRFDWERVMRELALVLPHNISLTHAYGDVGDRRRHQLHVRQRSRTQRSRSAAVHRARTPLRGSSPPCRTSMVSRASACRTPRWPNNLHPAARARPVNQRRWIGQQRLRHVLTFHVTAVFGNAPAPQAGAGAAATATPTATAPTTSGSTPATSSDSTAPTATPTSAGG